MKRIYYPYHKWEEYHSGMWRIVKTEEKEHFAAKAASLMKDPPKFKAAMQQAVQDWPISCEMNLSARCMNRRAWLGHAGCCVAENSPEEATRFGWHMLNQEEQDEANRVADEVIVEWEQNYKKS